jgi:hypothetical protein
MLLPAEQATNRRKSPLLAAPPAEQVTNPLKNLPLAVLAARSRICSAAKMMFPVGVSCREHLAY